MNTEKFVNSKFYQVCEWLWHIVVLNFLTIICSLGVITIIPSVVASLQSFKDYSEGSDKNTFSVFFKNFGRHFKKTIFYSIMFIVLAAFLTYSIMLWYANASDVDADASLHNFYTLGMYVTILFSVVCVFVYIQIPLIIVYFDMTIKETLRNAFYMSFKHFLVTLVGVGGIVGSMLLVFYATILWCFIGIALPISIVFMIAKKKYSYLAYNVFDIKDSDNYSSELDFTEEK